MKVLWITNLVFPEAVARLCGNKPKLGSGGWLMSLASEIKDSINLAVAAPSDRVKRLTRVELDGYVFYMFPLGKGNSKYNKSYEFFWKDIKEEFKPDIVHIHGTEYSHGLAYINACGGDNVIVSIQGVMTEIAKHYLDGLSIWDIISHLTLRDVLKKTLFGARRDARVRAESEPQILDRIKYVIGRTSFDHAHAIRMNPSLQYYHCDEILRDEFYFDRWTYYNCEPHTIFASSSRYPIKGFHMLLKALPIIKQRYPDVKVRVAGGKRLSIDMLNKAHHLTGYQLILLNLIRSLQLQDCVLFLGTLSAEEMKQELLKANMFISSSSNENSSNAIGEAQLLGVPCLASYVGGTADMIPDKNSGELYDYFDTSVLAYKICRLFETANLFDNSMMIHHAKERHNKDKIKKSLLNIYSQITEGCK